MYWRWIARRLGISAFLVVHLAAVLAVNLPASALRAACFVPMSYYLFPLGLAQSWGMFAPNPVRNTQTLQAWTVDRNGIHRTFTFPRMDDFSFWKAIPRVRHSKFTSNVGVAENRALREFVARHSVRQLGIPPEAFPVEVELIYLVQENPPPDAPPADPMKPPVPQSLGLYRYAHREDLNP